LTARQSRGLFPGVRNRTKHAFALLAGLSLAGAFAMAGAGGSVAEQAKRSIDLVEANPESKKLAAEPVAKARDALKRAADARAAGDKQHAQLLDDLALEWAESAGDLTRSAQLEQKSAEIESKGAELDTKAVRALAIIEEAIARRGRAQLELDEQQAAAESPTPTAAKPAPAAAKPAPAAAKPAPAAAKPAPAAPAAPKPAQENKQ
jgi:hypothetical protein